MSKRKKCCYSNCEKEWEIRLKAIVGTTTSAGSMEGHFCLEHVKQAIKRYQQYIAKDTRHLIKYLTR